MATLSKLLCEYIVTANVNDRFDIEDAASATHTITLAAGRYRDHVALAAEMETQLNAATVQTWVVGMGNTDGIPSISSSDTWDIDWDTSSYGADLRDDLGYTESEVVTANVLTGTNVHLGGFYPSEPVEMDNRPLPTGTDRWSADIAQQEGVTGILSTVGGENLIYKRMIQFLLSRDDDVENFQTWLQRALRFSFAFYHDRAVAWPGSSSEYKEYKVFSGDNPEDVGYNPTRPNELNNLWHRQALQLRQRVAPTV